MALSKQSRLGPAYESAIAAAQDGRAAAEAVARSLHNVAKDLAVLGADLESPEEKQRNDKTNSRDIDDDTDDMSLSESAADDMGAETDLFESFRALRRFRRRACAVYNRLQSELQEGKNKCNLDAEELRRRQHIIETSLARTTAGMHETDNDNGKEEDGDIKNRDGWRVYLEVKEGRRIDEARRAAEEIKAAELLALDTEWDLLSLALGNGDRRQALEVISSNAQGAIRRLDEEMLSIRSRRKALVTAMEEANALSGRLQRARETFKITAQLQLAAISSRSEDLAASCDTYDVAAEMFAIVHRSTLDFCSAFVERLKIVTKGCALVQGKFLGEHIDLAGGLLCHFSTLVERKERDVGTLAARLFQHSRQRQDAISRDSVDVRFCLYGYLRKLAFFHFFLPWRSLRLHTGCPPRRSRQRRNFEVSAISTRSASSNQGATVRSGRPPCKLPYCPEPFFQWCVERQAICRRGACIVPC